MLAPAAPACITTPALLTAAAGAPAAACMVLLLLVVPAAITDALPILLLLLLGPVTAAAVIVAWSVPAAAAAAASAAWWMAAGRRDTSAGVTGSRKASDGGTLTCTWRGSKTQQQHVVGGEAYRPQQYRQHTCRMRHAKQLEQQQSSSSKMCYKFHG
jgi:hypothetical protein